MPPDLQHYMSEISRVLKKGGRSFITYFLWNETSASLHDQGLSHRNFQFEGPGYRTENKACPEWCLAYDEPDIRLAYENNNFQIEEPIRYGAWSGRSEHLSGQDVVVAIKK